MSFTTGDFMAEGAIFTGSFTADNGSVQDISDQYPDYSFWEEHEAGKIIYLILENPDTPTIWYWDLEPGQKLRLSGFEE